MRRGPEKVYVVPTAHMMLPFKGHLIQVTNMGCPQKSGSLLVIEYIMAPNT